MLTRTDDLRIDQLRPLIPPAIVMEEIPTSEAQMQAIALARAAASSVIAGEDDRLLVVRWGAPPKARASRDRDGLPSAPVWVWGSRGGDRLIRRP
jgi:hypothetical protein